MEYFWRRNLGHQPVLTTQGALAITGSGRKPVRKTFKVPVTKGRYDIRIKRTTADATSDKQSDDTNLLGVRFRQDQVADTADQTRYGMVIKASGQISGSVDKYSSGVYAMIQDINNGDMWIETQNPAWWFLQVLRGWFGTNGRLVAGAGLAAGKIDYTSIQAWADFCDSKNLRFNAVFENRITVAEALEKISRVGRASFSMASGKIGVIWDAPNQTPVAMFGPHNMIAGSFTVNYSAEKLADEIIARFYNSETNYTAETIRVAVPGATAPFFNPVEVDLFGVVYKAQAGAEANLLAAAQVWRRRRITWETDLEGLIVSRGDVVLLSHDMTNWASTGRVFSASSTTALVLDKPITGNGTIQYLMLRRPDQSALNAYRVTAFSGSTDTITLMDALPVVPGAYLGHIPADYVWAFGPTTTPGKKVKIVGVEPSAENRVRLTAIDEDSQYYASETDPYTHAPTLALPVGLAPTIHDLKVVDYRSDAVGDTAMYGYATWEVAGGNYSEAHVFIKEGTGVYSLRGITRDRFFQFVATAGLPYTVKVVVYGDMGTLGASNFLELVWNAGTLRPGQVQSLVRRTDHTDMIHIQWTRTPFAKAWVITLSSSPAGLAKVVRVYQPDYFYTALEATADGGPWRTITFSVKAENETGQSLVATTLVTGNLAPVAPSLTLSPGVKSIQLDSSIPLDEDYVGMLVYGSQTAGFTAGTGNLLADTKNTSWTHENLTGTWYYRVAHYDTWGKTLSSLNLSAQVSNVPVSGGVNGTRTAILDMYQWASSAPVSFPSGTSSYEWTTGQFTAPATPNSWTLVPGTPTAGQTLYEVRQIFADTLTTSPSSITWAATTSSPSSLAGTNGANGANGANGQRVGILEVYQWAASAPTSYPSGTSSYEWATGVFSAPSTPAGWSLLPGAPSTGQTLWAISVVVSDALTTSTSTANWTSSVVYAVGAAGSNGATGVRGSRTLYSSSSSYSSTYNNGSGVGLASFRSQADSLMNTATSSSLKIDGDMVVFTNLTGTFVYSLTYKTATTAWELPGQVIDGSLLVTGSVIAAAITTNGLSIRDEAGNIILQAGSSLATSTLNVPGNQTNVPTGWLNTAIALSAGGILSGAGGGTVTAAGISAVQTSLANAPSTILNSNVSISAGGVLSGAGGGTVSLSGIGFTGDTNATRNKLTYSASSPVSPLVGDLWGDTSATPILFKVYAGAAWNIVANNLTASTQLGDSANIQNSGITIASGNLNGIGTGAGTAVANSQLSLSGSAGTITLSGGSGGSATGVIMSGNPITSGNASTYLGTGAIASTYIADLAATKITAGTLIAGVLYAGTISASQISVGTLTGHTIQTASSGARIVLNESGSTNTVKGYSAGGALQFTLNAGAGTMLFDSDTVGTVGKFRGNSGTGAVVGEVYAGSGTGVEGLAVSGIGVKGSAGSGSGIGVEGRSTTYFGGAFYGGTSSAPLYINATGSLPTTGNISGALCVVSNKLYFHNGTAWKEVTLV